MAVISSEFGGLRLTREDAAKFRRQVQFGRTNSKARDTADKGSIAARALLSQGFVKIDMTSD